jgi:hypothetical protein
MVEADGGYGGARLIGSAWHRPLAAGVHQTAQKRGQADPECEPYLRSLRYLRCFVFEIRYLRDLR